MILLTILLLMVGASTVSSNHTQTFKRPSKDELVRLKEYLFDTRAYTKMTPSVKDSYNLVLVEMILDRILEINAPTQTFSFLAQFRTTWQDLSLSWNESEWYDISSFVVDATEVWLPDISFSNNVVDLINQNWNDKFPVKIQSNGVLTWWPGGRFDTSCLMETITFPFDHQICDVVVSTLTSDHYSLHLAGRDINFDFYHFSGEWSVVANATINTDVNMVKKPWESEETRFTEIYFRLLMKRAPEYYVLNIVLPCFMLCLVSSFVFLVPIEAGEKISLVLTILLTFTVFLLIVADKLPSATVTKPLFSIYLNFIMILNCISLVVTIFLLNQHYKRPLKPVPRWLRAFVLKFLAIPFGSREWKHCRKVTAVVRRRRNDKNSNEMPDEMQDVPENKDGLLDSERQTTIGRHNANGEAQKSGDIMSDGNNSEEKWAEEWAQVALILDRLFFWLYLFTLIIGSISFLLLPVVTHNADFEDHVSEHNRGDENSSGTNLTKHWRSFHV